MSDLFVYLIKVNIALIIFCLGYYAVLRHLTFYVLNRVYLVCAIVFATLYPLVDFSSFINSHEQIARPVQLVIVNWQAPVVDIVQHDKWYWMGLLFWLGVIIMAVRFAMQLVALNRLHKNSKPTKVHQYSVRAIDGDINPFSFWKSIYVNPDNHDARELKAILEHEQVHVNEWHTVDIILGELSTIFYWFNPGVWLMKRAIRENIEFITDQKILQNGSDPKEYQYSLLNVSLQGGHNAIVNHFNVSTIKKRIMMMNSKRSSTINLTRYAFLVPTVVVLVLIFSISKAEFKKSVIKGNAAVTDAIKTTIYDAAVITGNTVVTAKRTLVDLPDAVQKLLISETPLVKLDTPKKYLGTTVYTTDRVVTGFRLNKADTSLSTAVRILNQLSGVVVNSDGSVTTNGKPISTFSINGITYRTATTPATANSLGTINYIAIDTPKKTQNAVVIKSGLVRSSERPQPLLIINGVEKTREEFNNLDVNRIESVEVLKDPASNTYGDKGKNGAIIINLKDGTTGQNPIVVTGYRQGVPDVKNYSQGLFADKFLIIDSKESNAAEANKIPANKIDKIKMIEAGSKELEKYGDKAKNGALVITTK